MDLAVPEHRFSVPGSVREEQLHTVTSGAGNTPFNKLLSLFSDGGSTSQAPWPAPERTTKPALSAAQKQELAAAGARSQKTKRGQKRSSPSEDGGGAAADEGVPEEEELDMSKLSPEEREQLANADAKEAKRLRRLLRNRCSAQLARERRKVYVAELEAKVAAHEQRIQELEGKLATAEQQNATLRRIILTMRPQEGAEPVPLPPVDAVRLQEKAAAGTGAADAAGAEDGALQSLGDVQAGAQDQQPMPQHAQQMEVEEQPQPIVPAPQPAPRQPAQHQAMPQQAPQRQAMPQLPLAPAAAPVPMRSVRTATPAPLTPQLPPGRQQEQQQHYHEQQQQQQQQEELMHVRTMQAQQQRGTAPRLPPLPPVARMAQLIQQQQQQQRVERSIDLGPFSVAYKASLEAAKLHQQKEQQQQQEQQQLQRHRYLESPQASQQQQAQRQQQQQQASQQQLTRYQDSPSLPPQPQPREQYDGMAGVQYDCDPSVLLDRRTLPVPIVPKSQLQQLLMQQQLLQQQQQDQQQQPKSPLQQQMQQQQMQQEQEQRQVTYAHIGTHAGSGYDAHGYEVRDSFEARPSMSEAHSHGNNSSSLHVVPTHSWRSHSGAASRAHTSPTPQQHMQPMQRDKQYEAYSLNGQYDAETVAQKYSDALGVVPKRHRSSHASSRRARDVVHVVPDVGAMAFPSDELLAALLAA